jgi:GNAT superfamily N-acetyltransferase
LYLVALDPSPVGACLVHWDGPVDDGVRRQLPEVVDVSSLFVAAAARGQGAGQQLIAEAERQSLARGRATVGVGVGDENAGARRLYERLGYAPSGVRYRAEYDYVDDNATVVHVVEEGDFLTKRLTALSTEVEQS